MSSAYYTLISAMFMSVHVRLEVRTEKEERSRRKALKETLLAIDFFAKQRLFINRTNIVCHCTM